nr:NADH dehydrogenase subunit 2 [Isocladus armatus]
MFKIPAVVMVSSTSLLGVLLAIVSESWFGVWTGLEMNLLSFIPLIMIAGDKGAIESGLKYFLVQACGSLVVLQAGLMLSFLDSVFLSVLVLALVLKAGGAPFHAWMPMIVTGLSWPKIGFLFSVQKLAPLVLLYYLSGSGVNKLFSMVILASAVVGAVGGVNEIYLKKLLAFSSISHFGWMCLGMSSSGWVWLFYYFSYCVMVLSLVSVLHKFQFTHMTQMTSKEGGEESLLLSLAFLSLGGMPPFLGFLPKWIVITESVKAGWFFVTVVVVITSLIALFYYLRASLVIYLNSSIFSPFSKSSKSKWGLTLLTLNLTGFWVGSWVWASSLLH